MAWTRVLLCGCLAVACNESEPAGDTDGDEGGYDTELPSPYSDGTAAPDEGDVPTMSAPEVVASAIAGLQTFVALDPAGVVEEFEAMVEFEDGCPQEWSDTEEDGRRILYFYAESCTTSGGLTIEGGGRLERWSGVVDGERTSDGAFLSGEGGTFRLQRGNGRFMQFSGYLEYDRGTYAGDAVDSYFGFAGEASADAQTAGASRLLDGSVRAQGSAFTFSGDGYKVLGGSGALTGTGLGAALAMSFDEVAVVNVECATEPAGTLAVRDDAGYWHDVVFDAASGEDFEYEWDPAKCDGCGTYLAGGVADGTACVSQSDLAPILDWEGAPW